MLSNASKSGCQPSSSFSSYGIKRAPTNLETDVYVG